MFLGILLKSASLMILFAILVWCIESDSLYRWVRKLRSEHTGAKEKNESTTLTLITTLGKQRDEEHRVNDYLRARISSMSEEIQKLNKAIIRRNRTIIGLRKSRKPPYFCIDEGCPQYGTKHICITRVATNE